MKKLILYLLLSASSLVASAQFILLPKQFRNIVSSTDKEKTYILLNAKGKKTEELYKSVLAVVKSKLQPTRNEKLTVQENKMIKVINRVDVKNGDVKTDEAKYSSFYQLDMYFQNEEIKIDASSLTFLSGFSSTGLSNMYIKSPDKLLKGDTTIFKKDNSVNLPNTKRDIEQLINNYIADIKKSI